MLVGVKEAKKLFKPSDSIPLDKFFEICGVSK
jgi:hypothetical protein